jgi:hypothetical protein
VNPDADIEWELGFHRAETFIMRSLHYPKLRVYLFSVLLYKAYFEAFEVPEKTKEKENPDFLLNICKGLLLCVEIFFSLAKHSFIKFAKASGTHTQYQRQALGDLK